MHQTSRKEKSIIKMEKRKEHGLCSKLHDGMDERDLAPRLRLPAPARIWACSLRSFNPPAQAAKSFGELLAKPAQNATLSERAAAMACWGIAALCIFSGAARFLVLPPFAHYLSHPASKFLIHFFSVFKQIFCLFSSFVI